MGFNYKEMIKALSQIEDERNLTEEIVTDALKDAMCKAYKKEAELSDIVVEAEINDKKNTIDIFQIYNVVEEVEDDELEMSLEDAKEYKEDAQIGDVVRRQVDIDIDDLGRAAANLFRNVLKQKLREAEKLSVYNEYIDQLNEMVLGIVESDKDKFTLVNLGRTVAMMPKSAQIPGERLTEGQKLRVVITEVNKETKGSQVLVSRASEMLVKRLFEKEVPEIYQGIVEIKAIAREAGERTKMAVMSHNEEIDPIGACIGQRGTRVQEIIDELHGEKIDIFLWSDDVTQLIRNALAPAEIEAVIPGDDDKSLLVIVNADQLSLAIGKKGKNARLAVKLCNRKIDIKTREELEEMGLDYDELLKEAEIKREQMRIENEQREQERLEAEARAAEEKRLKEAEKIIEQFKESSTEEDKEHEIPEEMREALKERIRSDMANETVADQPEEEKVVEEEPAVVEEEEEVEEVEVVEETTEADETIESKKKKIKADLEEIAAKNEFVSVFENLAETSKSKQADKPAKKKKKKGEEDEIKTRNKVLEQQLRKDINDDFKPVYTDEELEEIELQQLEEEESQYDIDYDEYEEYYDEDDN